jgi:hypothetical protein
MTISNAANHMKFETEIDHTRNYILHIKYYLKVNNYNIAMKHNSEVMTDKYNTYKTCASVISTSQK